MYGIFLRKLFWPIVRKNCSSDQENLLEFDGSRNTTVQSQRYVNDLEAQRKQLKARLHAEAENHKHYVNTANLSLQSVKVMFVILSLGVEPSFQLFSLGFQIIDVTLGLNSGISWAIQFNPENWKNKQNWNKKVPHFLILFLRKLWIWKSKGHII